MTFQADIASDVQKSAVGDIIFLYELDLTEVGLDLTLYFTEAVDDDFTTISFNSQAYQPIQMESEGWEVTGEGTLPRPRIKISNVLLTLAPYIISYDDLIGAKVTRRRTFKKYLDGESEANPAAEFPQDIYVVRQKTAHNKREVEFELGAYMDFEGVMIPKRQVIRDFCGHIYRYYDSDLAQFVNTLKTCPYGNDAANDVYYFDTLGDRSTDPADDSCGKRLRDCEMRFAGRRAHAIAVKNGNTIHIAAAEPVADDGDFWLNTGETPNVWYRKKSGTFSEFPPEFLPTRAFPGVGRLRI